MTDEEEERLLRFVNALNRDQRAVCCHILEQRLAGDDLDLPPKLAEIMPESMKRYEIRAFVRLLHGLEEEDRQREGLPKVIYTRAKKGPAKEKCRESSEIMCQEEI